MSARHHISLAPLQSFTDHHFRNAFQQVYGGIDRFYAPYLKMESPGVMKEGTKRDVRPELNPYATIIPQVLASNAEDFLLMGQYLVDLGYEEINWNLGCPYPMVAKRALGAGMLNKPELFFAVLDEVMSKLDAKIGLKMRMGYEDTADILKLLPKLNDYPVTEIIVHARYARQLYRDGCDWDRFEECLAITKHRFVYNGDINTVEDFQRLKARFPEQRHWMLGRGLVANPLLPEMMQNNDPHFPDNWLDRFHHFHDTLFESVLSVSQNDRQAILKMKHYWEYFQQVVPGGKHIYRKAKKAKTVDAYLELVATPVL